MTPTLIGDVSVAFLLVIMIFYAAKLSRRLAALRADKAELQALVRSLAGALGSAEAGVKDLRSAAEDIGRRLETKMQQAQSLRDDLVFLGDRGAAVADRLEVNLRPRREEAPKAEATAARPAAPAPRREAKPAAANMVQEMASRLAAAAQPSRAERDLARALAGRR